MRLPLGLADFVELLCCGCILGLHLMPHAVLRAEDSSTVPMHPAQDLDRASVFHLAFFCFKAAQMGVLNCEKRMPQTYLVGVPARLLAATSCSACKPQQ